MAHTITSERRIFTRAQQSLIHQYSLRERLLLLFAAIFCLEHFHDGFVQTTCGLYQRYLSCCGLMSVLEQAEELLARLNPAEKAQLIQAAARDLGDAFPGVESRPDVCGGESCIVRTRIPVWLLEQARRSGKSEAELLQMYPTLRAADLANAWAYVRSHRDEIEQQITQNEAA